MSLLLVLTFVAIAGVALGVWLTGVPHLARKVVPFSGGLLIGISVFWVFPELSSDLGWPVGFTGLAAGFGALWLVDTYIYPVCPSCSHTHDHDICSTRLHGFAMPLITAAAMHAFIDGSGVAAAQSEGSGMGAAVLFGVGLHKLPEGIALGVILRAAMKSKASAFAWAAVAESATLAGGLLEYIVAPHIGSGWVSAVLAFAGGSFLYLGFHAIHGEWKRGGALTAFMPALTGAAGAAALQQGLRAFLR